jgi:hypothetical protein
MTGVVEVDQLMLVEEVVVVCQDNRVFTTTG